MTRTHSDASWAAGPPRTAGAVLDLASVAERMTDARAGHRVALDLPVEVHVARLGGALPARLSDLGLGGACLATRSPLELGAVRRISLDLYGERVALTAEGRWQNAGSDAQVAIGVAFRECTRDDRYRIEFAIDRAARELAEFLEASPDFPDLVHEDAVALALGSRYRLVPQGGVVYRQGEVGGGGSSLLVVVEGEVALQRRVRDARNVTVERLGRGALFGGLPLFADVANLEYAVACGPTRLLEVTRPSFALLRVANPLLAYRVTRYVAKVHFQRHAALLERTEGAL